MINEPVINYQVGYREAIKKLIDEGDLVDSFFYSFYVKLSEFDYKWDLVLNDIVKEISQFRPDAVLFAHTSNKLFTDSFFYQIRQNLGYKPVYALDERDAYGQFTKRLPKELVSLSRKCDITFLSSSGGWLFDQFSKNNAGKVIYLPQCCDDIHFGKRQQSVTPKVYDIVMIGNLVKSRIPFNSMPGVKKRIQVAEELFKRHGKKFAVFGSGWEKYPFSAGPVPFFEQEDVLYSANMSIGVDHFLSYDQYYSDRLPIALFSGVPHLSWETPKIDLLFNEGKHIYYFNSVKESILKSEAILSGATDKKDKIVSDAVSLIQSNYIENVRMKKLVRYINDIKLDK